MVLISANACDQNINAFVSLARFCIWFKYFEILNKKKLFEVIILGT